MDPHASSPGTTSNKSPQTYTVPVPSRTASFNEGYTNGGSSSSLNRRSLTPTTYQWQPGAKTKYEKNHVVLDKNSTTGNPYTTRYRIDHKVQHRDMTKHVCMEECLPCCVDELKGDSIRQCCWTVISAEAFLLSLHLSALILGVVKDAANVKEISDEFELIHSCVETFVACLMIFLRIFDIRHSMKEIEEHVDKLEEAIDHKSVRGKSLKKQVLGFTILGSVLIVGVIASLIAFKFLAHLGWTILTNNFAMVVATAASSIIGKRISTCIVLIREDHHKAVIYESMLLLKESHTAMTSSNPGPYLEKVSHFTKAVMKTELFLQPNHIAMVPGAALDTKEFMDLAILSQTAI